MFTVRANDQSLHARTIDSVHVRSACEWPCSSRLFSCVEVGGVPFWMPSASTGCGCIACAVRHQKTGACSPFVLACAVTAALTSVGQRGNRCTSPRSPRPKHLCLTWQVWYFVHVLDSRHSHTRTISYPQQLARKTPETFSPSCSICFRSWWLQRSLSLSGAAKKCRCIARHCYLRIVSLTSSRRRQRHVVLQCVVVQCDVQCGVKRLSTFCVY